MNPYDDVGPIASLEAILPWPQTVTTGMDLRDWIAGMALQGMLSGGWTYRKLEDLVSDAYHVADTAMGYRKRPAEPGKGEK